MRHSRVGNRGAGAKGLSYFQSSIGLIGFSRATWRSDRPLSL